MKIAMGSDHGGFDVKETLKAELQRRGMEVDDVGCRDKTSVDYPDFARAVASRVSDGSAEQGLLVCTTGIGMAIAANRFPRVRAALCLNPAMATTARTHNNANVLVLGGAYVKDRDTQAILDAWFEHPFSDEARHVRRLHKIETHAMDALENAALRDGDPELYETLRRETARQQETVNLIASENTASRAVQIAQGSLMANKYAEGYPGKRWYNGCEFVDDAEKLAIDRARALFGCDHANVQPHCGSSANLAVYLSVLEPGDTILAMSLAHGGHLTHGHKVNISGRLYTIVSYGVRKDTGLIDYDAVERLAAEHKPKLIVAGASAYPRVLDFSRFEAIANGVGAHLMVDMAHIAGLVAGGAHPDPVPHAAFVTTTTHKTLRGPRSGMILCREAFAQEVDRQVFPGIQGGPMMHTIAAKAVCFHEALQPSFKHYAQQIVRNAAVMAEALKARGLTLVSGGTDNHLMLVDLSERDLSGRDVAAALDRAGIIVNKNAIPFDRKSPFLTSGIRIGTPAVTTRGMGEAEMEQLADLIAGVLDRPEDTGRLEKTRRDIKTLADRFPLP